MKSIDAIKITLLLVALIVCNTGCTVDGNKIDYVSGEWRVEEVRTSTINKQESYEQIEHYFIDFDIDNGGRLYDQARRETNTLKWGYQFAGDTDKFMISYQLENSLGNSGLSVNSLFDVRKLEEDLLLLTRESTQILNDTSIVTLLDLNLTRL